ncbi:hypothetical protein BX600DRAFT_4271 [Xylariales sp. PMI_506]|nr:hypothetical protein BX600DRAFT_4271 [Xylariales sp. PMI_506]
MFLAAPWPESPHGTGRSPHGRCAMDWSSAASCSPASATVTKSPAPTDREPTRTPHSDYYDDDHSRGRVLALKTEPDTDGDYDSDASPRTELKPEAKVEPVSPPLFPASASPRFRGQHPPAVWEDLKPEIKRLYIDEERTLKEVRSILEQRGFRATEKMYKDKFAKWGYNKNNRKKDVAKMVQIKSQRKAVGKSTVFYRNGKAVDLKNYFRRGHLSAKDLEEMKEEKLDQLPEILRCQTPPLRYTNIQQPDVYDMQDILVKCFQTLTLKTYQDNMTQAVVAITGYPKSNFYHSVRCLRDASWLYSENRMNEGGMLTRRAFSYLHCLIDDPSPSALFDLILYQLGWTQFGHHTHIWRYLANYAEVKQSPWLLRLFRALDEYLRENPLQSCFALLSFALSTVHPIFVPSTSQTLYHSLQGSVNNMSRARYTPPLLFRFTWELTKRLSPQFEATFDPNDEMMKLHDIFIRGYVSEWADNSVYALITDLRRRSTSINTERLCLRALAYAHRAHWETHPDDGGNRNTLAVELLVQALSLSDVSDFAGFAGGQQREVWEDSKLLAVWYRQDGNTAAADAITRKMEKSLAVFIDSLAIREVPQERLASSQ